MHQTEPIMESLYVLLKYFIITSKSEECQKIFENKLLCVCLFRGLSLECQQLILSLIFLFNKREFVSEEELKALYSRLRDCKEIFDETITELKQIKLIDINQGAEQIKEIIYVLNWKFLMNLQTSIQTGCNFNSQHKVTENTLTKLEKPKEKDNAFFEDYFKRRWNYVVGIISECENHASLNSISNDVRSILVLSGILSLKKESPNTNENYAITLTSYGFKYLLLPVRSQVITFLYHLIIWLSISKKISFPSSLSLITQLIQFSPCNPQNLKSLTVDNFLMVKVLREIGLLYMRKSSASEFYIGKITITLLSSSTFSEFNVVPDSAFLVVESNFRVYAYNFSRLQLSLLGLFCEILYAFPSMLVCKISRESCHQAYALGISASQLLTFLSQYTKSFKQLKNVFSNYDIPFNVIDQFHLWEKERNRLFWTPGVLYKDFNTVKDFDDLLNFTKNKNFDILQNRNKRFIIISSEGHSEVKKYWKSRKSLI